jgi:hypothetical protein
LIQTLLRWEPGVDEISLTTTIYTIIHKFTLHILGVESKTSGTASLDTDQQRLEIEHIIQQILHKNPFAKYGSDLLCNLNVNQRASIPIQELIAILFDEKYGEDDIYCSNCPWHTRPSFNQKSKAKKDMSKTFQNGQREHELKQDAENAGKKVIILMRCYDCHKHKWCTSHVEPKYRQFTAMFTAAVATHLGPDYYVSVNPGDQKAFWKLGCFDIFYEGQTIFKKSEKKVWPNMRIMVNKIQAVEEKRQAMAQADAEAKQP